MTSTPTAMADAMADLRAGRITVEELRAIMRASREADPAGHEARKVQACWIDYRRNGG